MRHPSVWLLVAASVALGPVPARAAGELATAASLAASALPELPRLAPITHPEPDMAALRELDRVLDQLTSQDARSREEARAAVDGAIPGIVDAIRLRVQDIRGSLDRSAAPRVLADARKEARRAQKGHEPKDEKKKEAGEGRKNGKDTAKDGKEPRGDKAVKRDDKAPRKDSKKDDDKDDTDGDWLDFMLATPHPRDSAWRDVVKLLAMERLLVAVGTTPAVRELVSLHAYFGELLRIDMQRQIAKLRDKAVPALIEARQHDARIVQRWANKQLDLLGRAIPGEAVASNDTQILADVLRAYGRTRDVDAVRVILSFSNSDRARLRDASREAIAAIGEPGIWQLRDVYLNLTGNKSPREWTWERIARELFATYDRARLAEVYKLMDEGVAQASAGKIAEATDAFDKVLARSPLFERRKEMIKTYVERARSLGSDRREEALAMMRKALRLDPAGAQAKKIEAEVAYLEGLVLIERGTPDKFVLKHALELDPTHAGAQASLASLEDKVAERKSYVNRYIAAGAVGFVALLSMLFIARRRVEPTPAPPSPQEPTSPEPGPEASPPEAHR
jgi:tetratricopeptide (TPR) repeat protein